MKIFSIAVSVIAFNISPAVAGPYVNVESDSFFEGFTDSDSSLFEAHVGFSGDFARHTSWYVQCGPALTVSTEADPTYELSGILGLSSSVSSDVVLYGEVNAITTGQIDFSEDLALGLKAGVTYTF